MFRQDSRKGRVSRYKPQWLETNVDNFTIAPRLLLTTQHHLVLSLFIFSFLASFLKFHLLFVCRRFHLVHMKFSDGRKKKRYSISFVINKDVRARKMAYSIIHKLNWSSWFSLAASRLEVVKFIWLDYFLIGD